MVAGATIAPVMRERRLRSLGWVIAALAVVEAAGAYGLDAAGSSSGIAITTWIALVLGAGLSVLGAVVVDHRPRNAAGWAMVVNGFLVALEGLLVVLAEAADAGATRSPAASLIRAAAVLDVLTNFGAPLVFLLFPDGHPPPGRWRWTWWAFLVSVPLAAAVAGWAAWSVKGPLLIAYLAHPDRLAPSPALAAGVGLFQTAYSVTLLWWVVATIWLIVLLARSRGHRRQQLKLAVLGLVTTTVVYLVGDRMVGTPAWVLSPIPGYLGLTLAMRRHHLFDVDTLLRRTAQYAILTLVLAGLYGGLVVSLGVFFSGFTLGSSFAVAGATLATTAAFAPLRRYSQRLIDRRFDRRTWQAVQVVEDFTARLRDGQATPGEVIEALRAALGISAVDVAYVADDAKLVDIHGASKDLIGGLDRSPQVVAAGGHDVAVVDVPASVALERPRLISSTLMAAALPLENAALHARAAVHLADVQASRARLVEAGDTERRRIERNLHDGAQQRLVALALKLRMSERRLAAREPAEAHLLDEAVEDLRAAVDELRDLTRGLLPPVVAEEGLAVALGSLAARLPLPVTLDVSTDRFDSSVEATAWFFTCEAVANAGKHAGAHRVEIVARPKNGTLTITVSDDGAGGARVVPGGGLEGLNDRVAAAGGCLRIDSEPGGGTTLVAELPCGS